MQRKPAILPELESHSVFVIGEVIRYLTDNIRNAESENLSFVKAHRGDYFGMGLPIKQFE